MSTQCVAVPASLFSIGKGFCERELTHMIFLFVPGVFRLRAGFC